MADSMKRKNCRSAGRPRSGWAVFGLVGAVTLAIAGCPIADSGGLDGDVGGSDILGSGGGLGGALDSQRDSGSSGTGAGETGGVGALPSGGGTDVIGTPVENPDGDAINNSNDNVGGNSGGNDNSNGDAAGDGTAEGGSDDGVWDGLGDVPFEDNPVLVSIGTNPLAAALPKGALRIVTIGDSVTEGIGDESAGGGGYPRRLLDRISSVRSGTTVLNLGKSGWSSDDVIQGVGDEPNQIDAAVAGDPDVVCLWIGSNDLWGLYEYGPLEGTSRELEVEDLNHYAANIELLLNRLQQTGAALYVGLLDDQSLRAVIEDRATLPNTTFEERAQMSKQVIRYNNVLIALAKRFGATLVDFNHTTIFTSIETMDPDGIHPNAAGYDVVAGLWYAAMRAAVEE